MNNTPTEYQECLTLVDYLSHLKNQGDVLVYTHTPQETYTTSWSVKLKNKNMGVRRGIPDYVIVTKTDVLFIEMKRITGNKPTDSQKAWIKALGNSKSVKSKVCYGFDDAKDFIDKHIKEEARND